MSNGKKKLAALLAAATLASSAFAAPAAFASGGGGSGSGTGGALSTDVFWKYKDGNNGSWGSASSLDSVRNAFNAAGVALEGDGVAKAQGALNAARAECEAKFNRFHPGEGPADCRVVAVGAVYATSLNLYDGSGYMDASVWNDAWDQYIVPNTYSHGGNRYTVNQPFTDDPSESVTSIERREAAKPQTGIIVIALNKYQPKPPFYRLDITTDVNEPTNAQVGDTTRITDLIKANGGNGEQVSADVILHFDGNAYVPAANAKKTVTINTKGNTTSPTFTPADLGMQGGFEAGAYWYDVKVAKQKNMESAVDTPDREASESFRIPATPPAPPTKEVEKGVSADQMTNTTTITSGTGRGGYEMTFTDNINPNGVKYTVENMKVTDLTTKQDVSNQFTFNWDKTANKVTARRTANHGRMPLDHQWAFTLDIVVDKPNINKVKDTGEVQWNQEPSHSTDEKEFPTWQANPDKSWIKQDSTGKWAAVIDPEETNNTGADKNYFLDGDKLASVVNGTMSANLIQAPTKFELMDDWTKADYLFDADTSKIKVFMADATTDTQSSVYDIVNSGTDVTSQFNITVNGTKATASMKPDALKALKGLEHHRQYTLLIPGVVNFANGKGAAQVRSDFGAKPGDEVKFCEVPANGAASNNKLTNSGSQTINSDEQPTNEPYVCGYVPPVKKDVVSESSQGGEQESIDGKVVFPGQKVEYQLTTTPKLPENLAYDVKNVVVTDHYDEKLIPDKQTVEVTDLTTGKSISKKQYTTKWNDEQHLFQLVFNNEYVHANWGKGTNPRIMVRFEGTVKEDAPTDQKINNNWMLTLNNSLTPSNQVFNTPPAFNPIKQDTQKDPSVNIDGKTALLGDVIYYRVNLDLKNLTKTNTAYKVQRAGIVDDYDDEYLTADEKKVEVLNAHGQDVTNQFNVQFIDGVAYVFAKTVDTQIPATGETIKGDPQPKNLKEYADMKLDPLKSAAINQDLLGQTYQVVLPMTVTKVTDGYTVKNTATQIVNDTKKTTNTVTNPLKPINPAKDVVLKVNGDSVNGTDVLLGKRFLYRFDSSVIPANRAYPEVTDWNIVDKFDTKHDKYLGQWAVYANRDLYVGDTIVAKTGDLLAGSDFDNTELLATIQKAQDAQPRDVASNTEQLFTVDYNDDGTLTVTAGDLYKQLVSADTKHEAAWSFFPYMERIATSDRVENTFNETFNDKHMQSNTVWTRTPDLTPSIHLEKWDKKSGWPNGDRDTRAEALKNAKNGDTIVFTITNTSKTAADGTGAVYRTKDLKLTDQTILGNGKVVDLKYPSDWDTKVLKPGESVNVEGTLRDANGEHTNRASVSGIPLVPCVVNDDTPFDGKDNPTEPKDAQKIDGKLLCGENRITSNTDDWNATVPTPPLANTGIAVGAVAALFAALAGVGGFLQSMTSRSKKTVGRHTGK